MVSDDDPVIDEIVVPAGIPVPLIDMLLIKPVVLPDEIFGLPLVSEKLTVTLEVLQRLMIIF
jgi:hypothetical protein